MATKVQIQEQTDAIAKLRDLQRDLVSNAVKRAFPIGPHCFREDNCAAHVDHKGDDCCCCGEPAEAHEDCDCDGEGSYYDTRAAGQPGH